MKTSAKILYFIMGALIIGLIAWNAYLFNINDELKNKKQETEENYQYLEGYNEILKYDLTTARDSVRILKEELETIKNQ